MEQKKSLQALETLKYKVLRYITFVFLVSFTFMLLYFLCLLFSKWENKLSNYINALLIGYFTFLSVAIIIFKLGVYKITPEGIENYSIFGLFKRKLPYSKLILIHDTSKNEVLIGNVEEKLITVFYKNYIANLDEIILYLNGRISINPDVNLKPSLHIWIRILSFSLFIRILISWYFLI